MIVVVTGGRDYHPTPADAWALRVALAMLGATEVRHGGARGVDQWAGRVCARLGIPVEVFPFRKELGKAGGPARNREMLTGAQACVVLPGGRGTRDCWAQAREMGLRRVLLRRAPFAPAVRCP